MAKICWGSAFGADPHAQDKLPVALRDGQLSIPLNGTASTHILKPDNIRLPGSVQNEALCMVLARRAGLPTAEVITGLAGKRQYLLVTRYGLGAEGKTGAQAVAGGLGNVASAGTRAAVSPLRRAMARTAEGLKNSYQAGSAAVTGSGDDTTAAGAAAAADPAPAGDGPPAWAARMRRNQRITHATQTTVQAVRSGDAHGGGHSVDLSEGE